MCDIEGCNMDEGGVIYKRLNVCQMHWEMHCRGDLNLNDFLKQEVGNDLE